MKQCIVSGVICVSVTNNVTFALRFLRETISYFLYGILQSGNRNITTEPELKKHGLMRMKVIKTEKKAIIFAPKNNKYRIKAQSKHSTGNVFYTKPLKQVALLFLFAF